jgi:hypothetical protein
MRMIALMMEAVSTYEALVIEMMLYVTALSIDGMVGTVA